jgi:hypothetical protein
MMMMRRRREGTRRQKGREGTRRHDHSQPWQPS